MGGKKMRIPAALTFGMAAALAVSACAQAPGSQFTPGNAIIRITDDDMKMTIDALAAPAGKVTFLVINKDKVDHEIVILKTDKAPDKLALQSGASKVDEDAAGENVGEVEAEAGTTAAGTFELAPGKYVLICNVLKHYMAGMYSAFEVKTVPGKAQEESAAKASPAAAATSAPSVKNELTLVSAVRPNLVNLVDAAKKGDFAGAKKALKAYNTAWNGIEVYVSFRSPETYTNIETVLEAKVTSLLDATPPNAAEIVPAAEALLAKYDEVMKLVSAGKPISPLFDDVATLRILRTNTIRDAVPAIKAGDVATAKSLLSTFITKWSEVEDLVHERSADAYADIENAMAKVNAAVQKSSTTAADLAPLADTLSNRFNYAVSLFNAAARGSDVARTTFTKEDVQSAASLATIASELKTSLTAWQGGKYQEAGDHAKTADGKLFPSVAGTLKAKNGADAAIQKALDTYAALSDKPGDANAVAAAEKAAVEAVAVGQQWIVGQFWTDPKLRDAITAAVNAR
jgi:uncharacterized cupredoxin-like copper-binding protein